MPQITRNTIAKNKKDLDKKTQGPANRSLFLFSISGREEPLESESFSVCILANTNLMFIP